MPAPASCPTCGSVLPPEPGPDDSLEIRLDGPDLVAAVQALRAELDDEEALEALDRITAGLCPTCGLPAP